MKVLHINEFDNRGGAAIAAYRLHLALQVAGIESVMLVQKKSTLDTSVISTNSKLDVIIGKIKLHIDQLFVRLYKKRQRVSFSPSLISLGTSIKKIKEIRPDIIHIHWSFDEMISIKDLLKIDVPIIWTLHDMWGFTGGCHYSGDCINYKYNCGKCVVLNSKMKFDISSIVHKRKRFVYKRLKNTTLIALSNWMAKCVESSTLLKDLDIVNLPNPLDTSLFMPRDKEFSREIWCLPQGKKLVLFGATSSTKDPRKGFLELSEALNKINEENIEFVVFGGNKNENDLKINYKVHYVGHVSDSVSLVTLYSSVDVMVVPSHQEAFGQTAIEAMACCTPVVAFNETGLQDIVDHRINGYLAKYLDTDDLAAGIRWILNSKDHMKLCQNARKKVNSEFDSHSVARKYIDLYTKKIKPSI